MTPGIYNLVLYRGDSYGWRFRVWQDKDRTLPTDLSGSTAAAQIRNAPGGAIVVNMDVDIEEPNIVNVRLTAAQSEALPPGGAWDLEITTDTNVRTVVKGDVTVQADVTT
jgi:hypothetical protein